MHRVARLARKLGTAKVEHALHLKTCEEAGESVLLRSYSKIPAEYENFYKGVQQPIRYHYSHLQQTWDKYLPRM